MLISLLVAQQARAQLVNENLLITFPQGFKVANDQKANGVHLSEMIPKGESLDDYSKRLQQETIRAKVLDWLAAGPHAHSIAAVRGAHPRHGGAGALYIVMKRPR